MRLRPPSPFNPRPLQYVRWYVSLSPCVVADTLTIRIRSRGVHESILQRRVINTVTNCLELVFDIKALLDEL